jgi:PadR family transcriptional regulator PadR
MEALQGTLNLMVLRTLDVMGTKHGFGLAKGILQVSDGLLNRARSTPHSCGWSSCGGSNRAGVYSRTTGEVLRAHAAGLRQIREESASWELTVASMANSLAKQGGE